MMVKVCGITNVDDAKAAVDSGATALGFNFYQSSPRYISPDTAAQVIESIPPEIWKVGVFVNHTVEAAQKIARELTLDVAQLHGNETAGQFPSGVRIWKAVRVDSAFRRESLDEWPAEAILLDTATGSYGGSGQTFDWSLAAGSKLRIILAGGLDASNVAFAIAQAHPWGVDACSRLEASPGKKDHAKMSAFLKAALGVSRT